MSKNKKFYNDLILHKIPIRRLLKDKRLFKSVPSDWHVIVTDVVNSTNAIQSGKHDDINFAATGSIITVLNLLKQNGNPIKIPYFFGGDGATFIVPSNYIKPALTALNSYSNHIKKTLNLELRVGSRKVENLYNLGAQINIAKVELNENFIIPVVLGFGLKLAEKEIKAETSLKDKAEALGVLDLSGMQCRWNLIPPPKDDNQIVCLIVNSINEENHHAIFEEVMNEITASFGPLEVRQPISGLRLKLNLTLEKIRKEMYARLGKYDFAYLFKNWVLTRLGNFFFKYFKSGKVYLNSIEKLSDTLMIDGSINTIISGNKNNVIRLRKRLDRMEKEGKIIYGMHITFASIMSCYVNDMKKNHIHFVDATEGGYTTAAIQIKNKLNLLKTK